ncbi:LuxR C-terminal-related transcriptional regulator [Nannocystaceae bacterium ST9]
MTTSNQVHIRVTHDDDANRISAVLEALGYSVLRELDEGDAPSRLHWAVTRLARFHKLTEREQDLLECVLSGKSNEDIGRSLEISRATVKWHMHNIFAKTNTGNRESLLRLALQLGGAREPRIEPSSHRPETSPAPHAASHWSLADDVTARIEFDQPRVPTAESIPSKAYF